MTWQLKHSSWRVGRCDFVEEEECCCCWRDSLAVVVAGVPTGLSSVCGYDNDVADVMVEESTSSNLTN